ncbi:hypothetical protein AVEN_255615-1 [Araneus ventricosus]|uniref:Uncharacterized protein n=1 Tax=Araneus ventricosus TaxID=182803 RepID=A0A4Y2R5B5_ARAVE|nr:hypothetical protein AVEN_255615-1 [Araneus ventricosus]
MTALSYTVRLMARDDVPGALEVWSRTGMQEATHCLYTWLEVDKEAFNIAVTDSDKEYRAETLESMSEILFGNCQNLRF